MTGFTKTPIVFYVARSAKLAYLQIPKAGCTAIRAAFCRLNHPEIPEEQMLVPKAFARNPGWTDIVAPSDSLLTQCFRFTFVRDPIERFCSFYRSKIQGRSGEEIKPAFLKLGFTSGLTLEETIKVVEQIPSGHWDPHFAPQTYFVFDPDGKSRVDLVGHLENTGEVLEQIEQATGIRLWTPRLNVTATDSTKPARSILSAETLSRLEQIYAADFAAFGYPRHNA